MATLEEIPTEQAFTSLLSSLSPTTLVILSFHTPWAAPCTQMRTILTTLASTYPVSSPIRFLSVNAEDLPEISEEYDVTAVPFLVVLRGGQVLEKVSGSDAVKVRGVVERYAGVPGNASGSLNTAGVGGGGVPPALEATPRANGSAAGAVSKDLSSYTPKDEDTVMKTQETGKVEDTSKEELNARLEKLVKAAPVMLFMKGTPSAPQCGFSRQLVSILRENQVKYGFFNILADEDVRQGLKEYSDWPTFPQLYTNGELVGGLDIVREEMEGDPDFWKPYAAKTEV